MPCDYSKYPANWREISNAIKERAGWKCEWCGVANKAIGYRLKNGAWVDFSMEAKFSSCFIVVDGFSCRVVQIILTTAHVHDPDPMNCDPSNLAALCQRCHNRHDAPMRRANAKATRDAKIGQGALL